MQNDPLLFFKGKPNTMKQLKGEKLNIASEPEVSNIASSISCCIHTWIKSGVWHRAGTQHRTVNYWTDLSLGL